MFRSSFKRIEPEFENPRLPETSGSTDHRPIRTLIVQGGILTGLIIALFSALLYGSTVLAPRIPFEWEVALAESIGVKPVEPKNLKEQLWQRRLQELSDGLQAEMGLPEGMSVTISYVDNPQVNAYAYLGGNLYVIDGLLKAVDTENALAFVVAHEIAHVKHRHVMKSMTGRFVIAGTLAILFGESDTLSSIAGKTGELFAMRYSRQNEQEADMEALDAIAAYYGHVGGLDDVARALTSTVPEDQQSPEIFSTHPDTKRRFEDLKAKARELGYALEGETTPLKTPDGLIPQKQEPKSDDTHSKISPLIGLRAEPVHQNQ